MLSVIDELMKLLLEVSDMRVNGGSDLARLQALQKQAFATRNRLDTAASEMTTNLKASRFEATGGNLTRLFALERSLDRNAVFTENIALTELRLEVMQESLGQMLTPARGSLDRPASTAWARATIATAQLHATTARQRLRRHRGPAQRAGGRAVALRRHRHRQPGAGAGRTRSSPISTRWRPGRADAAAAIAAIDAYFAKPAGAFYTSGYVGSADDLTPVEIGEGQRLDYGMRADQDELVAVLRAQAMAAVVAGGAFAGNQAEQMAMLARGGRPDAGGQGGHPRPARRGRQPAGDGGDGPRRSGCPSTTRSTSPARRSWRPTRSRRPRPTRRCEVQLESIYTVTSRLANLRFVNYMR